MVSLAHLLNVLLNVLIWSSKSRYGVSTGNVQHILYVYLLSLLAYTTVYKLQPQCYIFYSDVSVLKYIVYKGK